MHNSEEPVSLRNSRLFNSVLTRSGPMQRTARMRMSQDALLDAFILLYEECNKDSFKKDVSITHFINKYRTLVFEIKSLRVNLNDFELKNVIGRGHFGEVRVVKEKQTNDIYAMKIIKKFETQNNPCSVLFEEEHDIMCTATSNWLTTLQYSFQDNENLYFVMEYHSGGDLLSLLDRHNGTLTPEMARFYLAETALAIRALHLMGYVHRDIKPDNILLDRCGHVKLADFGSSAKLSATGLVAQTMPVGTPEYIAPEVLSSLENGCGDRLRKQCYGMECDYWSLGILAYEFVVGRTPFSGNQLKSTYYNILNHKKKLKYPDENMVPESLRDLISKLLEDPATRLKHDGVVKHPFFRETNWNNIRNEVPPFVPLSKSADDVSNFIEVSRKKSTPRIEFKDNKREFSGKHLPFIGFTFSHVADVNEKKADESVEGNPEKKNPTLEALLNVSKRENKNLVSKLFEAKFGKTEEYENLEKKLEEKTKLLELCEQERNTLQRELAKSQTENANMQRILELERQDRKEMEANALKLISENKVKIERNVSNQIRALNAKIEELNDKLTEAHTVNNELSSKKDRIKAELLAANNEIEILKKLESDFKNKMAEAREFKRKSVVGLESRLEVMANNQIQANILQQKLNEETAAKTLLEEKLKEMEVMWLTKESQYKQDVKEYEEKLMKFELKVNSQHMEIASLQVQLSEKPNVALLEGKLELEKNECSKLRAKVASMEQELTNSTHSFLDHESAIAAHEETMQVLEKELREASEEKIRLQKKLQKTKETEEENRQKLSNLEVVVDRLEQGVLKLEAENAKLKQQVIAHAQPITSEAEARYQEKITILEDQVAKLEDQLQKLRESSVLDKESLKTTQSALWKAEKELSDAKIDIRIAKREAKTAEDLVNKLQDELKKLNHKIGEAEEKNVKSLTAEREKLDKLCLEKASLKSELSQKDLEIKMLKNQIEELEELKKTEKQLKKEYNELCQKCQILEKQADVLREEKEKMKEYCQSLEMEKLKMEAATEELKHKICSLELNNQVLKETGAMLDEQLEDYDKFTTTQTHKIEALTQEKQALEKEIESVQSELRKCRQNLNEEKSLKMRAEQRVVILENEMASKDESVAKLEKEVANCRALLESAQAKLGVYEESMAALEMELSQRKQKYDALSDECQWLKKEASSYLTNLYSLRESNYKLTQDLEEEHQMVEALQERINELQNVITELEAFHKQREVKDEATKQQQNKLITFLQEKLDDTKKKKTFTDVLFGSRNKENVPVTSPSSKAETLKRSKNSKDLLNSPTTKEALSQLVKSPSSQSYFQRHASIQRMHHNIPHRFKSQLMIRSGVCGGCHSAINRGAQYSACTHCGVQAHPKCALTVPKTCGLPQGLVKHYAKSVAKTEPAEEKNENCGSTETSAAIEGWIKMLKYDSTAPKWAVNFKLHKQGNIRVQKFYIKNETLNGLSSSKTSWERRYARLEGNKVHVYENRPADKPLSPILSLNLAPEDGQVIIADSIDPSELSSTAKANIPYIVKIAKIPGTTCWPQEAHYLMILTSTDKPKWLAALNSVVLNSSAAETNQKYHGSTLRTFPKESGIDVTCVAPVNDRIILLGAEEGLFSLKTHLPSADPVKIEGVGKVEQMTLAPQIGTALMIVGKERRLVMCDHRALVSNAEAAACTNPNVVVRGVRSGVEDEGCLMFSLSSSMEGTVYLTIATSSKLCLMKWCIKSSEFQKAKILETLHPCNCVLYTKHSVIVGCDKFFEIGLKDFSAQEFLDPSVKSLAFWRIGSFPMQIFQITKNEYLLCFNEFGVFVNENGRKTQCDLKWSKVPCDFAYSKPYLFVFHMSSVEVIRVPFSDSKSEEDSICTSSTSTVSDSLHISLNNPLFLGETKVPGAIYVRTTSASSFDLVVLEGKKLYKDDIGSCASLNTIPDEPSREKAEGDEFSFTSSLVQSLEEVESSTPRHSDEESCTTYTISDNENNSKRVTFMPQIAL